MRLALLVFLFFSFPAFSQDVGGVITAGNAMVEAAKGIKRHSDGIIAVLELNSGQKINVYTDNKAYFVDEKGNQIPIPDGEYQDKTGAVHTFQDGLLVK